MQIVAVTIQCVTSNNINISNLLSPSDTSFGFQTKTAAQIARTTMNK